jgi:hypothetical protein
MRRERRCYAHRGCPSRLLFIVTKDQIAKGQRGRVSVENVYTDRAEDQSVEVEVEFDGFGNENRDRY